MFQQFTNLGSSLSNVLFGSGDKYETSCSVNHPAKDVEYWKQMFDTSANKIVQTVSLQDKSVAANVDIINRLIVLTDNISKFAHEHDFKNVEANGYRSFIKLWAKVFKAASNIESMDYLMKFLSAMQRLDLIYGQLEDYHNQNQALNYNHKEQARLLRKCTEKLEDGKLLELLYSPPFQLIQLKPSFALLHKIAFRVFSLGLNRASMLDRLRGFSSASGCAKLFSQYLREVSAEDMKYGFGYTDIFCTVLNPGLNLVRKFTGSDPKTHVSNVTIEIKSQYSIDLSDEGLSFKVCDGKSTSTSRAKFQIAQTDPVDPEKFDKKVLIFCHGGGFIGPRAHCFENICVRKWTQEMPGLTVVNFDYSLCPEERFPKQIQELLDFYLWLTSPSTSKEVNDIFGFLPNEIALQGESAGGAISISFIVALNEIRNIFDCSIRMPKALVLTYPKITHTFQYYPSMMSTLFDPQVFPQLLKICHHACIPMNMFDKESGTYKLVGKDEQIKLNPKEIFSEENIIALNILTDVFQYEKLGTILDTKLYILSGEFDPFLDEAIVLLKLWRGETDLRVTEDVGHAANSFHRFNEDGKKAHDELVDLIKKAFLQ